MGIDNVFDDYDDTDDGLRMQEFIKKNKDKMPKLSQSGEAKMREAFEDADTITHTKEPDLYARVRNYKECLGKCYLIEIDSIKGMREIVFDKDGNIFAESQTK